MKLLIVGLGSIGVRHFNNLQQLGVEDIAVCRYRHLEPPQRLTKNPVNIFDNYDEALEWKPDAVIIANPTALHAAYVIKAIEHNCHVYVEKPLSHNEDRLDLIEKRAKEKATKVLIGCQFRFHPNLLKINQWLADGLVGDIYTVNVDMGEYLPDWHPWEDYRQSYAAKRDLGGGVVLTQIHDLDYIYWLFGNIGSVYAIGGKITDLDIDVEDTALISMKSKNNVLIQIKMDYWRKPPKRSMHIVGQKGEIYWDAIKGIAELKSGNKTHKNTLNTSWDRNDLFISIMRHFIVDVLANDRKPKIPLSEGIEVLKIALAAKKSINTGQVIEL